MTTTAQVAPSEVTASYGLAKERIEAAREVLDRPLRLADKLLAAHIPNNQFEPLDRPGATLELHPDRAAMPDSSAQMALLQFMVSGRSSVSLPTTIHCDHLIRAQVGGQEDLSDSQRVNAEVYEFLETAADRYGIGLWGPGSGIIHQVLLERYAFPGGMLLGADSHTPNAGGLGMLAIGAGGAQALDAMVGLPVELSSPRVIGVQLTGELHRFTTPKDIILRVASLLTVRGGTGAIIEYFGEGAESLSATGKATICNMGAELGATTSIFGFDAAMERYLAATGRAEVAALAAAQAANLRADAAVHDAPDEHYDQLVTMNLNTLEPQVVGPHSPDRGRDLSHLAEEAREQGWPIRLSQALVGSCTNSSYEDIGRAAHVARQAASAGLRVQTPLLITPGSETIRATIERDGLLGDLEAIGAVVLANACGPCIGQWQRSDVSSDETNAIVTSFNRNFPGRNDGSANTLAFIASPEIVVAMALAGHLAFDPNRDTLPGSDDTPLDLKPPQAEELPADGFVDGPQGYQPATNDPGITVSVQPDSERLQLLEPFHPWTERDYLSLPVLLKVDGKCTTDHISPAGRWLQFRGHLDRISDNLFSGANNVFAPQPGHGVDQTDGETRPLHEIARNYRAAGRNWVVIGGDNYGEGSSREHAAMEPRHLGCIAVVARSFARIHETNLKKHGILPLSFVDPSDHERIRVDDQLDLVDLHALRPESEVVLKVRSPDDRSWDLRCQHTLSDEHIAWFRAGSALNALASSRLRSESSPTT